MTPANSLRALTLAASVELAALACGKGGPTEPAEVTSIAIDRSSAVLAVGGRVQLTATARTAGGVAVPDAVVSWTSDNASVAVTAQGQVTGTSYGAATITATSDSRRATAHITVLNAAAGDFAAYPRSLTLALGQRVKLSAVEFDSDGLGSFVQATWSSSSDATASVDASGTVSANDEGATSIRATFGNRTTDIDASVVRFAAIAPVGLGGGWAISGPFSVADTGKMAAICAITSGGALYCAGKTYGSMAVPIATAVRFSSLVSTIDRFCALSLDGLPYCWTPGAGDPSPLATTLRFASIATGNGNGATCGLTAEGKAYCWGPQASKGQLGHGSFGASAAPVAVASSETFGEILAHDAATCARSTTGTVYCWGGANLMAPRPVVSNLGVLGIGTDTDSTASPAAVGSSLSFSRLTSGGQRSSCALTADGRLYCWGWMANQSDYAAGSCLVGPGVTTTCSRTPTAIMTDLRFVTTAPTTEGMCALTTTSKVACWAISEFEVFGVPSGSLDKCGPGFPCLKQPAITIPNISFKSLYGSGGHNICGIDASDRALCWGANNARQLTDSTIVASTPTPTLFAIKPGR